MEVDIFALCEAAHESGGMLSLLGVFDTISSDRVPIVQALLTVVAKIRLGPGAAGQTLVKIVFLTPEAQELCPPFELPVEFNERSDEHVLQLVARIQMLMFPAFGKYTVALTIDGKQVKSLPLFAKPKQTPAGAV
ncbi:MAG: DUF6941 family protein [Chthoniobacterales bacterium]